jgi:O-antigen/teichoic acid export membrane protein
LRQELSTDKELHLPSVPQEASCNNTGFSSDDNAARRDRIDMNESEESHRIDRSLVSGIGWTALLRWSAQLISWIGTFYAARILMPSDYGLISMAMLVVGLARMVEDFGMDAILVQDRTIVGAMRARLAGFLLILGLLLCLIFGLLSYPIAVFFREPQVALVVLVLSTVFITDALQVVPRAQLQRDLQFRRLGIVTFVQVAATQVVLVTAATLGFGYWSLVLNMLAGAIAATLLLVYWCPYKISWPKDTRKLAAPLVQGWRILASRIAWYGYSNADQTIIGRVLGRDSLGAYSFATTFSSLAQQEVGSIVSRVVPGIFSEVQKRHGELRRYFLLLTELLTVITFPMAIGLALVADLLIPLLLGPQWEAVIAPLRLLCVYSAFLSSQALISHVLMWTGQFRVNMWCSVLAGVTMPLIFLGVVDRGLEAVAWSWVVVFPIVNVPAFVFAFRTIDIRASHWIGAMKPALLACAVMTVVVLGLRWLLPSTAPLSVTCACAISVGALSYVAVIWFGFRRRVDELVALAGVVRRSTSAPVYAARAS